MTRYTILIAIVLWQICTFAQTGPGGVGTSANNILWLKSSTLTENDGVSISTWTDESGNVNSPAQLTSSSQPTMSTNQINSLPAVDFDGINDRLDIPSSITTTEMTTFIVSNSRSNVYSSILAINKHHISFGSRLLRCEYSDGKKAIGKSINNFSISSISTGSNTASGTAFITNGNSSTSYSRANVLNIGNSTIGSLFSSGNYQFNFDGLMSEVIVFNEELNSASRKIVSNYLGAKYNLTPEINLYNFASTNGKDVMGIGQELDGSNISAKGTDSLRISNVSGLEDGEYFLTGNDGGNFSTSVSVPTGVVERWSRVWKADMTGSVGTVDLEFYLGTSGFAATDDYIILLENIDGDFSNGGTSLFTTTPTLNSGVLKFTGVTIPDGAYFTLAEGSSDITAIANGNWNLASTWDCSCIPNSGSVVSVNAPFTVTINANAEVLDLNVNTGGSISFSASNNLKFFGNISITGSLVAGTGTISASNLTFNQNFTNNTGSLIALNNFHSSTSGTVSMVNNEWTLSGNLQVDLGKLDVSTTSSFTLLSNASKTAQILPSADGSLIGNYTIQRFVSSRNANYGNFSSPMEAATVNDLDDDLILSGIGGNNGNASIGGGGIFYSIKTFNRFTEAHENVTSTATVLEPGNGYEIYLATTSATFNATTIDYVGVPTTGALSTVQVNQGWNLIANPYQSFLSWPNVTKHVSVPLDYYIFNTNNGSYDLVNEGVDLIAPGQGFWINMLPSGGKLLTFNENDKSSSNSSVFLRKKEKNQTKFIISSELNPFSTEAIINFEINSSVKFDEFDAPFLSSPIEEAPAIYMKAEMNDLSLTRNSISPFEDIVNIPIIVDIYQKGQYLIESENLSNIFNNYSCAYVKDNSNDRLIDLQLENSFTFQAEKGVSNRFNLVLSNSFENCEKELAKMNDKIQTIDKDLSLRNTNGTFYLDYTFREAVSNTLSIEVLSINGQLVKPIETFSVKGNGSTLLDGISSLTEGIYLIRIIGDNVSLNKTIKL